MVRMLAVATLSLLWSAAPIADTGRLETKRLNPSGRCGECHMEIYSMWKRSMHSLSYRDPIFEASYMQAYRETAGKARELCLRCHAPVAVSHGDLEMRDEVSHEGITCDYCHSVASVNLERRGQPLQIRLDGVKRGPLADAESPVHGVERSSVQQAAEFCAGCHEYVTDEGLPILSTYSEWKLSPQAAEGKTCQKCHMPLRPGDTVRPGMGKGRKSINLHNISGGHSPEQVRSAATARILRVEREQTGVAVVEIEIANVGSGHSIPTGLPTRKLVLDVTLLVDGREVRTFRRIYQRVLMDARRQPIVEDHRVFLEATGILEDTRLKAGERRVERFVAQVPAKGTLHAEMNFHYLYEPQILSREQMRIDITTDRMPRTP